VRGERGAQDRRTSRSRRRRPSPPPFRRRRIDDQQPIRIGEIRHKAEPSVPPSRISISGSKRYPASKRWMSHTPAPSSPRRIFPIPTTVVFTGRAG